MKEFLAEFWLWIAIPFFLVMGGLAFLYFWTDGQGSSPFDYNVF